MDDKLIKAHKEALEKNDIDNFVSFTAIGVSAGRLAEGMRDDQLYRDPLIADMLQSSKGIQAAAQDSRDMMRKQEQAKGNMHVVNMVVQRTHYLEDKLMEALAAMPTTAAAGGIQRQVVLLGSGLDTRAWRLDFPSGTAVFEVDQRDMTNFKLQCLRSSMAQTHATSDSASSKYALKAASWASVATDLMHADWIADLEAKGFQKGLPTAYLAEGLLYYLSPDAVRHLLSTLSSITVPGSALLFSCINEAFYNGSQHDLKEGAAGKGSTLPETTRKFNEAFKFGIPNDVAGFLRPLGWDASADGAVKDVKDTYKLYGVQEFVPDEARYDGNKELNEKLFGPKKYFLVGARLSS